MMRVSKAEMALLLPGGFRVAMDQDRPARPIARRMPQSQGTLSGLAGRVARVVATVATWPQRRAVAAELRTLSDRELADIGLTRADIP